LFKIWYNSKNIIKVNKSFDLLLRTGSLVFKDESASRFNSRGTHSNLTEENKAPSPLSNTRSINLYALPMHEKAVLSQAGYPLLP